MITQEEVDDDQTAFVNFLGIAGFMDKFGTKPKGKPLESYSFHFIDQSKFMNKQNKNILENATNEDFVKLSKYSSVEGKSITSNHSFIEESDNLILTSLLELPNRQYKVVPTKVTLENNIPSTAYLIYVRKKIIFNLYYKWYFRYYATSIKDASYYLYTKQLKYQNHGRKL